MYVYREEINYYYYYYYIPNKSQSDISETLAVVGITGKREFQTVSGEKSRSMNSTVSMLVSAGGLTLLHMIIFKTLKMKPEWRELTPFGYLIRGSASGYSNPKLFYEYSELAIERKNLTDVVPFKSKRGVSWQSFGLYCKSAA